MTRQLTYLLVADGGTDQALIPIIEWAIHRLDPEVEILEPDFRKRHGPIEDYVRALETGAMLVFVHRDSEGESLDDRRQEFVRVTRPGVVPVIPVRMTEAWLLTDPAAIAFAADHAEAVVPVPKIDRLEGLADPKQLLEKLLLDAANVSGRRKKQFLQSMTERRVRVAARTRDFSSLESLSAFRKFQEALRAAYPYVDRTSGG